MENKTKEQRKQEKEEFIQTIIKNQGFSGSEHEIRTLKGIVEAYAESIGFELTENTLFLGTNGKTGSNIVNLSFTSAIHCPEAIKGHCKVQKPIRNLKGVKTGNKQICYACSINNRHIETFMKNVWNYIIFNTLTNDEIIKQIKSYILTNGALYLRFNEYGSFINEECIKRCITISNTLIKEGYIKNSFSYTSNKHLFKKYCNVRGFVLSYSEGFKFDLNDLEPSIKKTGVVTLSSTAMWKNNPEKALKQGREVLIPLLNNPNIVICCGNCSNCPYCKNNNDKRLVLFLRHGNGWNGHIEDYLTEDEYLNYLETLHKDNIKFQ